MTDTDEYGDDLRRLTRRIFGRDERDPAEIERQRLATPTKPKPGHVVASEGGNPRPPGGFTREDHLRQIALELFHPAKAITDPYTFDTID